MVYIKTLLQKYNQEHLLKFMERLNASDQKKFLNDLKKIDFELINTLYNKKDTSQSIGKITPVNPINREDVQDKENIINIGKNIVNEGKLALITMAGGQGTRLGFNKAKGMYKINDKSLFEIISDTIKKYNIAWLIMTSDENNLDTVNFFKENKNFGIKNVKIFKQEMLPLVDENGKILVGENGFIKFGADGSGGIYKALATNNLIEYLKSLNVKYTFINGVDNVLTNPVDFLLIGLTEKNNYELASKSVVKVNPEEKVGVFCYIDNKPAVVEYVNLSDDMRYKKNAEGSYEYYDAHVLANLLSVGLLDRIKNKPLNYYAAHKKSSFLSDNNELIKPEKPNAYKFESFLFDGFSYTNDFLILRTKRNNEFAPIKNSDEKGVDCPKTALELYENYHNSLIKD